MAKKPLKISEILNRKKTEAAPINADDDFLAESQRLISKYSENNNLEKANTVASIEKAPINDTQDTTNSVTITEQLRNDVLETHLKELLIVDSTDLNACKASPLSALASAVQSIHDSKAENPRASKPTQESSVTTPEQLRNNTGTESVTQSVAATEQLRNNSVKVTKQLRNKSNSLSNNYVTTPEQLRNNTGTESVTQSVAATEQLRNNSVTNFPNPPHVNRLAGNKLKIVMTIHDFCLERGSLNSGPVSREVFESRTGIDGEVIRVTGIRLVKEGFISILESKRGNGGYTVYELNPITHSQLTTGQLRNNSVITPSRLRNDSVTGSVTENVTSSSYSNSSISKSLNSNTTILDISLADRIELPPDLIPTGIKLANIVPHVKNEADLERINDSLAAYAFDYSHKRIIKTAVFYGAIKSGQYFHSDDYVREMEKERQKQALAAKAREEASRQEMPSFVTSPKTKAEEEFDRDYSPDLVKKIFAQLEKGDLDILQPMLEKGLDYLPFRETLKSKFIVIRTAELENDAGRG